MTSGSDRGGAMGLIEVEGVAGIIAAVAIVWLMYG